MRAAAALLVAASLLAASCSRSSEEAVPPPAPVSDGAADGWAGKIEERGGVVYVQNPEAALWAGGQSPMSFELEAVFGAESGRGDATIGRIGGVAVDAQRNVHVYDSLASQLVSFDPLGAVRWRVGGESQGIGGFSEVRGIAFDGRDAIWVVNRAGTRLDTWGIDGEHRRDLLLEELGLGRVFMGGFLDDDRIALIEGNIQEAANDYAVVRTGPPARVESRFRISAEPEIMMPPGFIFQLSNYFHHSEILVGTWERYVLRVFDATGSLRRHVSRPVDYLRRPGFAAGEDGYSGISFGGLSAPVVLASGHWLVYASWPTNVEDPNAYVAARQDPDQPAVAWASSLDLFDADGRFLYSALADGSPMPPIGRPWLVGTRGGLYTVVAEPFPQVRRYRVELSPPESQ